MTCGLNLYIGFAQQDEWRHWAGTYAIHAEKFETASGNGCLVVPFTLASADLIERIAPRAVVLSGFARSFQDYDVNSLRPICNWLLAEHNRIPTLALCGSHQLLGFLFNGEIEESERLYDQPMRRLASDEPVTNPDYHPEYYMEKGFYRLILTDRGKQDPLFKGFDAAPTVCESHYCEIKTAPPEFDLLASTPECRVQAIRHKTRPLYGFQFHPEDSTDRFPDGMTMLERFFGLAGGR